LGHEPAGRVRHLLHHGVGDGAADRVVDNVTVFAPDVEAAAHGLAFDARYPGFLANPAAGALHLVGAGRTGAIMRFARARVEAPRARQPAGLGDHGTGAVVLLDVPVAGLDRDKLLGPHRLIGTAPDQMLARFLHRMIHRHRYIADVLLVLRAVGGPVHGHLVVLVAWPHHCVGDAADVLFVHGAVGSPVHGHLVVL